MGEALTGTGLLLRLGLRRDRLRLPIWTFAIAIFVLFFFNSMSNVVGADPQATWDEMSQVQGMLDMFAGPFFGMEAATVQRSFLMYNQEFLLAAGLMNILLVVRHTRGEEQSGRAELVRTAVIGRHAPLTAAMGVAVITNAVLAALLGIAAVGIGFPGGSASLFGVSVAATGLFFAGVTAITAQVADNGRTAGGLAGLVLVASTLFRGAAATQGNDNPALWFSPMAWSNLTRMLDDERWSPVVLTLGVTVILAMIGYLLSTRRDVGAGFIHPRSGRVDAGRLLGGPLTLALRLQRGAILWWSLAMVLLGLTWGALVTSVTSTDTADVDTSVFGDEIADGYLSLLGITQLFLVGIYALTAMGRVRTEETDGRLEGVLGTATGRIGWLGSWVLVTALGATLITLLTGWALGTGAAAALGDGAYTGIMTGAIFARLPEILTLIGISAVLYGLGPRWQGLAWAMYGYSAIVRFFGSPLGLPDAVQQVSIFQHVPRMPVEDFSVVPIVYLSVLAAALVAAALIAFRRRDIRPAA